MLKFLVAATLLVTACKKEEEAARPVDKPVTTVPVPPPAPTAPSDKPGETAAASPTGTPAAAPAAPGNPTCDKLVPASLRDKYFAGFEAKDEESAGGRSCSFINATQGEVYLYSVMCVDWDDATFQTTMERGKKSMKNAKDLPGIGKAAYVGETPIGPMIQFRDDDTNCYGTLTAPADKAPELAKELVGVLTPAIVGK